MKFNIYIISIFNKIIILKNSIKKLYLFSN
jgi:hypothetical protein